MLILMKMLYLYPLEVYNFELRFSQNAIQNGELTLTWVKKVVGTFSFNRRLLARDSYECHMTDAVKKELNEMKVD